MAVNIPKIIFQRQIHNNQRTNRSSMQTFKEFLSSRESYKNEGKIGKALGSVAGFLGGAALSHYTGGGPWATLGSAVLGDFVGGHTGDALGDFTSTIAKNSFKPMIERYEKQVEESLNKLLRYIKMAEEHGHVIPYLHTGEKMANGVHRTTSRANPIIGKVHQKADEFLRLLKQFKKEIK